MVKFIANKLCKKVNVSLDNKNQHLVHHCIYNFQCFSGEDIKSDIKEDYFSFFLNLEKNMGNYAKGISFSVKLFCILSSYARNVLPQQEYYEFFALILK